MNQDLELKSLENRFRRVLKRHGCKLHKVRANAKDFDHEYCYWLEYLRPWECSVLPEREYFSFNRIVDMVDYCLEKEAD